jgi:hypothetical protein
MLNEHKYTKVIVNKDGKVTITNQDYVLKDGEYFLTHIRSINIFESVDSSAIANIEIILPQPVMIDKVDSTMYTIIDKIKYKLIKEE